MTSLWLCCATFGSRNSSFRAAVILASPFCPTSQAFDQLLVMDESMDFKYYHGIPLAIEQQIPSQIARNSHTYASLERVNEPTYIIRPGRQLYTDTHNIDIRQCVSTWPDPSCAPIAPCGGWLSAQLISSAYNSKTWTRIIVWHGHGLVGI